MDSDVCMKVCDNPAGCSNIAYPKLVMELMPVGKNLFYNLFLLHIFWCVMNVSQYVIAIPVVHFQQLKVELESVFILLNSLIS